MAIKYEAAKGDFTSFGGLALFKTILRNSGLKSLVKDLMPTGQRKTAAYSFEKFQNLIFGFLVGNDCLDDMNVVSQDPVFKALSKKTFGATCYGNFLRDFEPWQITRLNKSLRDYAFRLRKKAFPKDNNLIIDIDSTSHVQYGKKMEGVAYNYKNEFCLDSLRAYDQFGFCFHSEVRPGNTFTANGAAHVIRSIFHGAPRHMHRYLRGDSGYCNFDVITACLDYRVDFVIAMRANLYEPLLKKIDFWKWRNTKNIYTRDGRKCQIAVAPYFPKGLKQNLRVVVIRAVKHNPGIFEQDRYDHFAWVTNLGQHEMSNEQIIEFYRKRGNAENFIREEKNGFDMHHFPCQKLNANKVFGLISSFAYNAMRFAARVYYKRKLHFSKKIRFRMIFIGAHVVKKARNWIIRISPHRIKEVKTWEELTINLLSTG